MVATHRPPASQTKAGSSHDHAVLPAQSRAMASNPPHEGQSSIPQAASTVGGIEESAERIRRQEVSRALARMALSLEEETAVEWMSLSLVHKLLRGPISEAITCAESGASTQDQRGPEEPG